MRSSFVKTLCNLAKNDPDLFLITGDLGFGVLDNFRGTYPGQFINAGITEQAMSSIAAGQPFDAWSKYAMISVITRQM
jgi:transketolase